MVATTSKGFRSKVRIGWKSRWTFQGLSYLSSSPFPSVRGLKVSAIFCKKMNLRSKTAPSNWSLKDEKSLSYFTCPFFADLKFPNVMYFRSTNPTQPIASQRNIQRGWSRVWSEILLEFELRKPCTHLIYWQLLYLFSFLWMTGEIDVSLLWWVNCQILEAFIQWMTIGFQVYSPNTHIFCPWKQAKLLPKTKGLPCNHQMSGLWPLVLGRLCPFFRETKRVAKDSHKNCQTVSNFPWKKSPTYQCKPR